MQSQQPPYGAPYGAANPPYGGYQQPQSYPPGPPPNPSYYQPVPQQQPSPWAQNPYPTQYSQPQPAPVYDGSPPKDELIEKLGEPRPPEIETHPRWKDVWATVLFVAALGAFGYLASLGIPRAWDGLNGSANGRGSNRSGGVSIAGGILQIGSAEVGEFLGAAVGTGVILSSLWFLLVLKFAGTMIHITYWLSILANIAIAAWAIYIKQYALGIIIAIVAIVMLLAYWSIRSKVPFAKVMLKTVIRLLIKFPATLFVSFVGLVLSAAFSIAWILSLAGVQVYMNEKGSSSGALYAVYVAMLLIFYWTIQVIKNTVHVTVSGLFATIYFQGVTSANSQSVTVPVRNPTAKSAGRALTTSFGSICFGSLLIAIIQTIRQLAQNFSRDMQNSGNIFLIIVGCCLSCILICLEGMLAYFNLYAFTQVAIYGKGYWQAGKDTWNLFMHRGLEAVINDNLIGNVLFIGGLGVGLVSAGVGYAFVRLNDNVPDTTVNYVVVCVVSFLVGLALFSIMTEVVTSGVATTFVCLAEDPATLARNQPLLFAKLRETWPGVAFGIHGTPPV
ncbi:putative choline transporter, neither null mutation nor overexpression affects choline transport [Borealophlyctis nickersoniae]|nr:putative choline transporter, neither null mutation nor overexpression affects choline transport [Borealophlyctis nickersoniae]